MPNNTIDQSPDKKAWLLLAILSIIWGSSFILIKRGLDAFDPLTAGVLRPTLASVFMLFAIPFVSLKKIKPRVKGRTLLIILLSGTVGIFIPSLLFSKAQGSGVDSSIAGSINAITPLVVFLIGAAFFGVRFSKGKLVGLLIGLFGAILLILGNPFEIFSDADASNKINWAGLFVVAANLLYGVNANIVKKFLGNQNPLVVAVYSVAFLAPIGLVTLFGFTDFVETMQSNYDKAKWSLFYISILALMGTAIASFIFNLLIQQTSAVFATSVTYFIPIIAIIFGITLENEAFLWYHFVGVGIILFGVFWSNRFN